MRDPHVVHVMRTLGHGGMEKNMRRVALALERRGIRHSIVLLSERKDLLQFPPSIPVRRIVTAPRDPRVLAHLARRLFELEPTVIHARNWASWPDTALSRLISRPRTPLVFSYHGMDGRTVALSDRLKFQAIDRLTSRIFAVSHAARNLLVQSFGLSRDRIGVILNGIDLEVFHPPAQREAREKIVIGAVGRCFAVKNFPLLMRAVKRLVEKKIDVELRIAGDGPDLETLRALITELALEDRIVMSGYVEDVPRFLHALDVFALSSDNEANPNALLEAMATGLPCVSTDVGGAAEVLDRGGCGLLVPARDESAMAEALAKLAADPGLRDRMGKAARARVVENYTQDEMFDAYERLYRDPLGAALD